ncbi:protein kinase [Streptomyces sp. DW4-2]|uniref:mitogen-activated protein kinase kinase n=2 Tax=Streptomyces spirodelae TaxID=2812904 RepID=A0ABS3WTE1_9ACTN|nr:protein kinase [Streptomyces spirodelae]
MGRVYLARSPGGHTVAVKILLADPDEGTVSDADRRRFAREVALARRVGGVFTASVVDADADSHVPWMATEYIPAPSLRELVVSQGPLPPAALHWIAAGMVEALVSIHAAGLVHRDIKPSNILLPEDGPRLIDFGISQAADITRTKATFGTVAFAAPEQARGEPTTAASDVFSLGATLFYLATGRSPYRDTGQGSAFEQLVRAAEGDLDLDGLPTGLDALILPCLTQDPARRPTAHALLDQVGAVLAERPQARGATDWLPEGWSSAIEQYGRRRTQEVDAAQRRIAPDAAATVRTPPATAHTRHLPRSPGLQPPRLRRTGVRLTVALAAAGLLTGGGVIYALQQGGEATPGAVREDLRLALVEQIAPGECTDKLPPPTFYSQDQKACFHISTAAENRMSVKQLRHVRTKRGQTGWMIQASFQDEDAKRFADLTSRAAQRRSPQNHIAIVLGDRLISAPAVTGPISGGAMEISGSFTKDSANKLAKELGAP